MTSFRVRLVTLTVGALLASGPAAVAAGPQGTVASAGSPGSPLTRSNNTPFTASPLIVGARWTSARYDPPGNQWGDILPTIWSEDGGTYVLMDDGGVDVPLPGGLWRQSLARVTGRPPNLRFQHIGDPTAPQPKTWAQIGSNRDNDDGPLGPYYSIGFVEAGGVFYATQQRNWNWHANGPFTGLVGIAYSTNRGKKWHVVGKPFPAPLGNLTFVDGGAPGGAYPDGYVYAIGTEREFNASRLLLGRARPGIRTLTDPADWQWFAGYQPGLNGSSSPQWTSSLSAATPVLTWNSHITYPDMTYDAPLHRYLLTFTYSYSSRPQVVWNGGAELVILEAPSPSGPFSFVARSSEFGPSNGYGAGFPSQWISRNGRDLWLKWAANFAGCKKGLDCSGKYGFNVASIHLTVTARSKVASVGAARATGARPRAASGVPLHRGALFALSASLPFLLVFAIRRGKARATRRPPRRNASEITS